MEHHVSSVVRSPKTVLVHTIVFAVALSATGVGVIGHVSLPSEFSLLHGGTLTYSI